MATEARSDATDNLRVLLGLVWQRAFPASLRHALETLKDVRLAGLRGSRCGRHGDELVRAGPRGAGAAAQAAASGGLRWGFLLLHPRATLDLPDRLWRCGCRPGTPSRRAGFLLDFWRHGAGRLGGALR